MRITNDNITELKENEIFVFGSNLSGIHGGGAAKLANREFGAIWGNATGLQGQTYAIPTKSKFIVRTLDLDEIKPFVDEFIEFAKIHSELIFFVTEIGCGLATHTVETMAPLFKRAMDIQNIFMPTKFWQVLSTP